MGGRRYCLRCLNGFASAKSLAKHEAYCEKHPIARRVLPEPEKAILCLQFNHLNYSMRVLLVVFWSEHVYDRPSFTCVIYSWLAVTKEQCGCSFD